VTRAKLPAKMLALAVAVAPFFSCFAQGVSITATPAVPLGKWVSIQVATPQETGATLVRVRQIKSGIDRDVTTSDGTPNLLRVADGRYAFTFPAAGDYLAEAVIEAGGSLLVADAAFTIGAEPQPIPDGVPFPSPDGLRVLIIEETAQRGDLAKGQQVILFGREVRKWLDDNTVSDGEFVGWRIWDDDYTPDQLGHVSNVWKQAYTAAKQGSAGEVPWLVAANGASGYAGPLPDTAGELLELLEALK